MKTVLPRAAPTIVASCELPSFDGPGGVKGDFSELGMELVVAGFDERSEDFEET